MQSRAANAKLSNSQSPEPSVSASEGAEIISLAHARDACMPEGSSEITHACIADAFDELVKPLGLVGPNRDICRDAYVEAPDEFAALVDAALLRGRLPAALLVRMVKAGDHRKHAARSASPVQPRTVGPSLLERRIAEEATRA